MINRKFIKTEGYKDLIVKMAIENQIDSKYTSFLAINERDNKVYDVPQIEETPIEHSFHRDIIVDCFVSPVFHDATSRFEQVVHRSKPVVSRFEDKTNGIKIGQAVQKFFSKASLDNSLSEELIYKLCDKNYCKQKFGINRPVLKEVSDLNKIDDYRKDSYGYARYYRQLYKYNGKIYILCSQWTTAQEPYFYQWVKFHEAKIIL